MRPYERGTGVSTGPGIAAIGSPEHEVVTIEVGIAAIFVHASDVNFARD
jgi:hypothetical protein